MNFILKCHFFPLFSLFFFSRCLPHRKGMTTHSDGMGKKNQHITIILHTHTHTVSFLCLQSHYCLAFIHFGIFRWSRPKSHRINLTHHGVKCYSTGFLFRLLFLFLLIENLFHFYIIRNWILSRPIKNIYHFAMLAEESSATMLLDSFSFSFYTRLAIRFNNFVKKKPRYSENKSTQHQQLQRAHRVCTQRKFIRFVFQRKKNPRHFSLTERSPRPAHHHHYKWTKNDLSTNIGIPIP